MLVRSSRFWQSLTFALIYAGVISVGTSAAATIDFEGFSDSTFLTTQLLGTTVTNAIILTAGITLNEAEFPPHSGTNIAADIGGPITITFANPVPIFSAYFTYTQGITVAAFNSLNSQIATAT